MKDFKPRFLAAIAFVVAILTAGMVASPQFAATLLTFDKSTGPTATVGPNQTVLWVNAAGILMAKNGTTSTQVGTGATGGSGGSGITVSTVWPAENIQNPVVGMFATGPIAPGYSAADSMYQQAQYMGPAQGWRKYIVSAKKVPFP